MNPCNQILNMMKYGVNRVTLVGNVGDAPRVSERDGEAFVANFPLATNEVWKNKEGEEVQRTEWHRIVVWNRPAEVVKQHVKKGDALYVEGKISTNSWEDPEGNRHFSTEIVCDNFLFLSPRNVEEIQPAGKVKDVLKARANRETEPVGKSKPVEDPETVAKS